MIIRKPGSYRTCGDDKKTLRKRISHTIEAYDNLTVDFAQQRNAKFIIRGIRTVRDFEYEETIADINRKLAGIETILLFTEPELTAISSTIVRELLQYGKDVTPFLPEGLDINL